MLYLDNAATTPVLEAALRAAWPWLTTEFGNPSSTHELGLRAKAALDEARASVAASLGAKSSEVVFTSGATEANNLAIKGLALANPRGRHIVSSPTEHESVLQAIDHLVRIHDFKVTWLPVGRDGLVTTDALLSVIRPDTTLVALMWVNNETGAMAPIAEIAEACRQVDVPLHVDAVQAVIHETVDVSDIACTSLALSGHKLGAPKGSGALFVRSGSHIEPLLSGGGQEASQRSGTENVAWAVAFAVALDIRVKNRGKALAFDPDAFIERVLREVPGAQLSGDRASRSPLIASFVFEGVAGETVLLELERRGVICSSGSACAAGRDEPSHVLTAMGLDADLARTAVRFSFTPALAEWPSTAPGANQEVTNDSLDEVVEALREIVTSLR
ncbi:MAG: hypothetical protein RL605_303 [Actinomycetota bacterium]|jgi:cysteine desulfurase